MNLIFTNNTTKKSFTIEDVNDIFSSKFFYNFKIRLPENIDDGEYTIKLVLNDDEYGEQILFSGLCQIGDYIPEKTEYVSDKITSNNGYYQYNG